MLEHLTNLFELVRELVSDFTDCEYTPSRHSILEHYEFRVNLSIPKNSDKGRMHCSNRRCRHVIFISKETKSIMTDLARELSLSV